MAGAAGRPVVWAFTAAARVWLARWAGALLVSYFLLLFTHPMPETPLAFWIYFAVSTSVVAFFEETLFRGALFNAYRDLRGAPWAVLATATVFTVFHYQAQPYSSWPQIFLIGVLFGMLRARNVSLYWLIAIHWAIDTVNPIAGIETDWTWVYPAQAAILVASIVLLRRFGDRVSFGGSAPSSPVAET